MSQEINVLLIGAEGTGKTLLLKRLQHLASDGFEGAAFNSVPSTVPTVGTNIVEMAHGKKKYQLRELGGAMAPIWHRYYEECNGIIFMIDASNSMQVSCSAVLLFKVLGSKELSSVPVLVLFNKLDAPTLLELDELKQILRIEDLKRCCKQQLKFMECVTSSGRGLSDVQKWIQELATNS